MYSQSLLTIKKLWMPIAVAVAVLLVALAPLASAARLELPTAPTNLRTMTVTQPSCTQSPCTANMGMQWDALPAAQEVTSYKVFKNGVQEATVTASATPTYTSTGVSGTTYSFFVQAVNSRGTGPNSNTLSVTASNVPPPSLPPAPVLRLTQSKPSTCSPAPCTSIFANYVLEWDAVVANPAVTGYNIYQNGVDTAGQTTAPPRIFLASVAPNSSNFFNAQSINSLGKGPLSPNFVIVAPPPPTTPANLQYTTRPHTTCPIQGPCFSDFVIGWSAPVASQQILNYKVFVNGVLVTTVTSPSYTGRANLGTTSNITVQAVNTSGISASSATFVVAL
jgi:hypothetical protein